MAGKLSFLRSGICIPDFRGAAVSGHREPFSVGTKGGMRYTNCFLQNWCQSSAGFRIPNPDAAARMDCDDATAVEIKSHIAQFAFRFPGRKLFRVESRVFELPNMHGPSFLACEQSGRISSEGEADERLFVRQCANRFGAHGFIAIGRVPNSDRTIATGCGQ